MASTYVNDLRLNEMATGDASGTWGTVTNTNLELIGEALGYGTEGITTNADTHTTTVADGATDPGRAMYIEYTGTLDSACTITIAPNTLSRMHFIENGTSGSQNIIIKQGSGATITIPPGDTKAVYLDGAGSGAAVVDAFASLSVVDLKVQDDLTVTDDLIVGGDIDLEGAIDVNGTANLDVVDIDGAVDMASTLQVDGAITSSAGATITVADNSNNLTLTSTDADANVGPVLRLFRNSASPADNDQLGSVRFSGEDSGGTETNYAQIDAYAKDVTDGTEDALLVINTMVAGTSRARARIDFAETVFNSDSVDVDFRVESDVNANSFYLDGATGVIGLGFANTDAANQLHILGTSGVPSVNMSLQTNDTANARAGITLMSRTADNSNVNATLKNETTALQSSLGISFGSDTAAANALDDYEEGTFEPTAAIAGGSGTVTFTSGGNLLSYTKIGNTVFITGTLEINSNNGNGGRLNVGNLPFTSANGTDISTRALMDCRMEAGTGSQASGFFTVINEGGSHIQIQTYTGITSTNNSVVTMAVNSTLTISGNYQAA